MSNSCSHDCSTCSQKCEKADLIEQLNPLSRVGKVIGVVSGKGGVGKSLVTAMLAVMAQRNGMKAAIIDDDLTGPSIPKMFGVHDRVNGNGEVIFPAVSKMGIDMISMNLLLENETDPVIWRGPVIAGLVKQFWTEVVWKDEDIMFIDMPPGTGDVPLTVFQSVPLDGIVVVSTPQELVGMIVEKAVNMAKTMNIPVLALVENMSFVRCPDCGKEIRLFGESRLEESANRLGIPHTARVAFDPELARLCDQGLIELHECVDLDPLLPLLD